MPRRQWEAKTTALLVLEGIKGTPVAELCAEHQISQAPYYQWRERFLAHAPNAFEGHEQSPREARLAREHARLKTLGENSLWSSTKAPRGSDAPASLDPGGPLP